MTQMWRGFKGVALLGLGIACLAGLGLRGREVSENLRPSGDMPEHGGLSEPIDRTSYDPQLVDKTIAFWKASSERDPEGAIELRELAGAYLARQRERGDIADAVKAEEAARESLKILSRNNTVASIRLARGLLAQHRFSEALEAARLAASDPQAGRLVADVQLELGDYDAAERALAATPPGKDDLNYFALLARIHVINGKPDEALRLLRKAQRLTDDRPDMPAETVAWYHTMVGHTLIESGRLEEGEQACRDALKVFPRDYRAMTGIAAVAGWRGDWRSAIEWGEKAVGISLQNPEALRIIGDGYAALGRDEEAERQYQRLKELAHSFPRIYDRHWALFCADKGRDLDEALSLARKDLELRQDVHAYDTLAWVCFKKGMMTEADSAIQNALSRGTQEATLLYHAGMVARALGDPERAKDCFTRARAINPHSIPLRWLRWMEATNG